MQLEPILFAPVEVSRAEFVERARAYLGVPYSPRRNYIARDAEGAIDVSRSSLICYGLLLAVARDVGWIAPDFNINRARRHRDQTVDDALWELLQTNAKQIKKTAARAGDVLLMWFRDVEAGVDEPHHVAIQTEASVSVFGQRGRMIHVIESDPSLEGHVVEQDIDALERTRIHSVWRLNFITD